MPRRLSIAFAALLLLALPLALAIFFLSRPKEGLTFSPVAFEDLPGWQTDHAMDAMPALRKSCDRLALLPDTRRVPGASIGGTASDWAEACAAILAADSEGQLRQALVDHFQPLEVSLSGETEGVFTGYYETLLHGSDAPSARYGIPLYRRPSDLVSVDLGAFRADLKGRRIAGRVDGSKLVPFDDRRAIDGGALVGQGLELLWVDDAVDAFFLHIQGSGRVMMEDGTIRRVGYADQNGHVYFAIGRKLIADGDIPRDRISMQSIRAWLDANPDKAEALMHENPSYVFFRYLEDGDGPIGSAGVALTAGRSLAVDRRHLPLHAPLWLAASHPDPANPDGDPLDFARLMVAQDTGGAINGEIRGDVFWGFGPDAEIISGHMNNPGRYWLLLPKALADRAVEQGS